MCDSFRYIPLETRDSVLIEEVTDVRLTDDRSSSGMAKLRVFDQNGRFLNKIGNADALGEYGAIDHFYISKNRNRHF
ncbi:MAG: 6-bladed beta-propeller [Odoribacter splanchnicus]